MCALHHELSGTNCDEWSYMRHVPTYFRVTARAPTEVAKALATSLAPMPTHEKCSRKERTKEKNHIRGKNEGG